MSGVTETQILHRLSAEMTPVEVLAYLIRKLESAWLYADATVREDLTEAASRASLSPATLMAFAQLGILARAIREEVGEFDEVKRGFTEPLDEDSEDPTSMSEMVAEVGRHLQSIFASMMTVHTAAALDAAAMDRAKNALRRGQAAPSGDGGAIIALEPLVQQAPKGLSPQGDTQ